MQSLTKVLLTEAEIAAVTRAAFGADTAIVEAREAGGGMYNAGYHLSLRGSGPDRVFLKVAPPDAIACLTYERHLMRAEVETLAKVNAAGVGRAPALLAADTSRRTIDRDLMFMQPIDGRLLSDVAEQLTAQQAHGVRAELAALASRVQDVTGGAYGYPHQDSLRSGSWSGAFGRMLNAAFDDALRFGVLPAIEPLRERAVAQAATLEFEGPPRLVHYDLWDGNVLVTPSDDGWRVAGLIDWERAFYGDPLAEIVSLTFHSGMTPDAALLAGWPISLDETSRPRLALYRVYLWLLMLVEAAPRGFLETQSVEKWPALRRRLERDLAEAEGS